MKNKLIKWGVSAALLLGIVNNAFSGILYSQKQVKQNVKLEQVLERIRKKYPKKQIEYFSKGFLQFKEGEFVKDSEIERMIEDLNPDKGKAVTDPNYVVDGVNFNVDYTVVLDEEPHHIGDGRKEWFPVKKDPEGTFFEKKFIIKKLKDMRNPRITLEVFSADSDNNVHLNGKLVGLTPKITKKQWENLMNKYKNGCPFLYGEIPLDNLKEGENIVKIESKKSGRIFKSYDDFMIRRIQIVYGGEEDKSKK